MSALPLRLLPSTRAVDPLLARAQRLWPESDRNQREWLRAVAVVRKTTGGWQADRHLKAAQ